MRLSLTKFEIKFTRLAETSGQPTEETLRVLCKVAMAWTCQREQ